MTINRYKIMKWIAPISLLLGAAFSACAGEPGQPATTTTHMNTDTMETETAVFASGCFWGTEYFLKRIDGVINTTTGYTGGHVENPTYEQVCSKTTGHYEAVMVEYDPSVVGYEEIARVFFETHDPTQDNGQGPDIGPQYRSAIFVANAEQRKIAEKLIGLLETRGHRIATRILDAQRFWPAELYHQDYYDNKGGTPYCHSYRKLF